MSETVPNALTPDEWARVQKEPEQVRVALDNEFTGWVWRGKTVQGPERRHAVAALLLHGQPFGFTRADVDLIDREMESYLPPLSDDELHHFTALKNLRSRVAALLPPSSSQKLP